MKQHTKSPAALLVVVAFFATLTACQSRPKMTTVDAGDEKPINTPEAAQQLKQKFEK